MRLFASYKERVGSAALELCLPEGACVESALDEVLRMYPSLPQDASRLLIAVNEEFQAHEYALSDGDELALIPPVSGGSSP